MVVLIGWGDLSISPGTDTGLSYLVGIGALAAFVAWLSSAKSVDCTSARPIGKAVDGATGAEGTAGTKGGGIADWFPLSGSDADKTIFQFVSHDFRVRWWQMNGLHRKMYLANQVDKVYAPFSFSASCSIANRGDNTAEENVFCFVQMSRIFLAFSCRSA